MVGVHITGLGHGLVDVEGEKNQDSTIQPQEADTLDLSCDTTTRSKIHLRVSLHYNRAGSFLGDLESESLVKAQYRFARNEADRNR